jgi:hypothetical protein
LVWYRHPSWPTSRAARGPEHQIKIWCSQSKCLLCPVNDAVNDLPCSTCAYLNGGPIQPALPLRHDADFLAAPRLRIWRVSGGKALADSANTSNLVRWRPEVARRHGEAVYDADMTTERDHGNREREMLRCELRDSHLYPSLELALRDMRQANGRDPMTGAGDGNESWIGLSMAMIVLDTLSGDDDDVGLRWKRLLTDHGLSAHDAEIVYGLRCALLHGYGPPKPAMSCGRKVLLSDDRATYAVDTSRDGHAVVSVPVLCGRLVERIATEVPGDWDDSLINTDYRI